MLDKMTALHKERLTAAPPAINISIQMPKQKEDDSMMKQLLLQQAIFQSRMLKKNDEREENMTRVSHIGGA